MSKCKKHHLFAYLGFFKDGSGVNEDKKSNSQIDKPMIQVRGPKKEIFDRRKPLSNKKYLSSVLSLHRPNTRMSRKIIEQDLELLRQANNNIQAMDLTMLSSNQSIQRHSKTPSEDVISLSLN